MNYYSKLRKQIKKIGLYFLFENAVVQTLHTIFYSLLFYLGWENVKYVLKTHLLGYKPVEVSEKIIWVNWFSDDKPTVNG